MNRLWLLLFWLLFVGCSDVTVSIIPGKEGEPCSGADSCEAGLICVEGICMSTGDYDG